jgi:hypothetical protein
LADTLEPESLILFISPAISTDAVDVFAIFGLFFQKVSGAFPLLYPYFLKGLDYSL